MVLTRKELHMSQIVSSRVSHPGVFAFSGFIAGACCLGAFAATYDAFGRFAAALVAGGLAAAISASLANATPRERAGAVLGFASVFVLAAVAVFVFFGLLMLAMSNAKF
jgi:MFS family permease